MYILEMFRYRFFPPDTDSDTCAVGIGRYRVPIRYQYVIKNIIILGFFFVAFFATLASVFNTRPLRGRTTLASVSSRPRLRGGVMKRKLTSKKKAFFRFFVCAFLSSFSRLFSCLFVVFFRFFLPFPAFFHLFN